jgi:hypothetical protein
MTQTGPKATTTQQHPGLLCSPSWGRVGTNQGRNWSALLTQALVVNFSALLLTQGLVVNSSALFTQGLLVNLSPYYSHTG